MKIWPNWTSKFVRNRKTFQTSNKSLEYRSTSRIVSTASENQLIGLYRANRTSQKLKITRPSTQKTIPTAKITKSYYLSILRMFLPFEIEAI
jgi:hypothetical protein